MSDEKPNATEAPFGANKRDWTLLRRFLAIAGSALAVIAVYAGSVYVERQAAAAVQPLADLQPRLKRIEEIAADRGELLKDMAAWRAKVDDNQTRLTILLENQQKQMDRQQLLIDRMGR